MRILKSIGLVAIAGLYLLLITNLPFFVVAWSLGLILAIGIFCWGYFILFKPQS